MSSQRSVPSTGSTVLPPSASLQSQVVYENERLIELRRQVTAQEQRLFLVQQQVASKLKDNLQKHKQADESAVEETDGLLESLVLMKERELALALMRVAELTRQLEQLRQGRLDGTLTDSTSSHAQLLDRNPELLQGIVRPLKLAQKSTAMSRSKSANDIVSKSNNSNNMSTKLNASQDLTDGNCVSLPPLASTDRPVAATPLRNNTLPLTENTDVKLLSEVRDVKKSSSEACGPVSSPVQMAQLASAEVEEFETESDAGSDSDVDSDGSFIEHDDVEKSQVGETHRLQEPCQDSSSDVHRLTSTTPAAAAATTGSLTSTDKTNVSSNVIVPGQSDAVTRQQKRLRDILASQQKSSQQLASPTVPSHSVIDPNGNTDNVTVSQSAVDIDQASVSSVRWPPTQASRPADIAVNVSEVPSNTTDLTESQPDTTQQTETRPWVSSLDRCQRLSPRGANRYSNIASQLYGDWFNANSMPAGKRSPSSPNSSDSSAAVSVSSPMSPSAGIDFELAASPISKTSSPAVTESHVAAQTDTVVSGTLPEENVLVTTVSSENGLEFNEYEDKDSSDDDNNDNDNDDDDEEDEEEEEDDSGAEYSVSQPSDSFGARILPRRADSFLKKSMVQWRQRLVASPPPRRVVHTSHRIDTLMEMSDEEQVSHDSSRSSRHVTFDPFTLSLNAALEGELDVLKNAFSQMDDVNEYNEDGLTVLHNGVCSGSHEILEFLVHAGCDVNVTDCDGWTPLHCAASSNNIDAVRLLVERGASLLAFSWDADHETPIQKCCPDAPGFVECYQYLTDEVERLGTANSGWVYAIADYEASSPDELSFSAGDQLTVLHKEDEEESEWWWSRRPDGAEGYAPPNLLVLYPPTGLKQSSSKTLIETSC